jgi:transmembrane sensor
MNPDEASPDAPRGERIRQQAAEWIVRRDAGFTAGEQDEFFEWLSADPRHAEAYAKLQAFYKRMDVMVEWRPLHALEPNPDLLAVSRHRFRRGRMLAWVGGMAALIAIGFTLWRERPAAPSALPVRLAAGEAAPSSERHALEDGSVVELNRGAQVAVRFEPRRRVLDLVSGEAYFQVAEDKARPFVVRVGGVAVTAVGTEFNLSLTANRLEVLVTKGRVRVEPPPAANPAPNAPPAAAARTLDAGHGVVVATDAPASPWIVEAYTPQVVAQKLAWKNDLVDFRALPLSEVILEFNRRHHTQLVIADEELTHLPITGSLRLTNLDSFLELLTVTHGIQVERQGTSKIVLHRSR